MAVLIDLRVNCRRCSHETMATHTLLDKNGRHCGNYCWRHAQESLAEQDAAERYKEQDRAHTLHRAPGVGGD